MRPPFSIKSFWSALYTTLFLALNSPAVQAADVSFYAVEKAAKYNQSSAGSPTLGSGNPYRFEAAVAPNISGSVQSATVSYSGGAAQTLDLDQLVGWYSFNAKFTSQALLDAG